LRSLQCLSAYVYMFLLHTCLLIPHFGINVLVHAYIFFFLNVLFSKNMCVVKKLSSFSLIPQIYNIADTIKIQKLAY
jgi:hypothetical protein